MNRREFCRTLTLGSSGIAGTVIAYSQTPSAPQAGSASKFLYILRLAMAPDFHEEEHGSAMLSFCRETQIDDVAFILWAEELNTGHPTLEEVEPWLAMVEKFKPKLAAQGVSTSLNPWVVLLHADRGRALKPGQSFRLMVDPWGREASTCACPLDPALHEHLRLHYERLASVRPRMIWVDDDFRLHNHAPLRWGGCFCDLHMKEFSRRAGRALTRAEFVTGVLQPGSPHPFRRVWLDTSRDVMVNLAKVLGNAVQRVSPETEVGLMSSSPSVHCIEGRDWAGVLRGLAAGHVPANRPHLPAYTEVTGPEYLWNFSRISRLSAASVPPDTRLYPELENWPHSRFAKSRAFTKFQIESSPVLGSAGITMDIFDLFGNGVMARENYGPMLVHAKQLATRLRELNIDPRREKGVQVLFNPEASYSIWTGKGETLAELAPEENFWAGFLSVMGIANTYRQWSDQKQEVLGVSGQYFRGLKEAQVRDLLVNNTVLLNGDAVFTLHAMGMGEVAGVKGAEWIASDSGIASYEQVVDDGIYAGLHEARPTAQALTGDYLRVEYTGNATVHTEVRNPSGMKSGPGMAVAGRNCIILPYGRGTDYQGLRHPVRQVLLQTLISGLAGARCPTYLRDTANVAVHSYDLGLKQVLLFVNASGDDYSELRFCSSSPLRDNVVEITQGGMRELGGRFRKEGNALLVSSGLRAFEIKALVFE